MSVTVQQMQAAKRRRADLSRRVGTYAFALIAPFIAMCMALFRPRDPASKNVIWLFVIFYGSVFFIAPWSTADSASYARTLAFMHGSDYGIRDLWAQFFAEGSRYQDIYQPLLTFFVAIVTDEYWLLFAANGILYGYVFSRNVWFLIDRSPRQFYPAIFLLILGFAFIMDVGSGLNGFRMWTALQVFLFGLFYFLDSQKKRYLIVISLTPLIHFSFWLPLGVFGLFFLVRRYPIPVFVFFILSFFLAYIDLALVRRLIGLVPLPLEERVGSYLFGAEQVLQGTRTRGSSVWFLALNRQLLDIFSVLAVSWLMWRNGIKASPLIRGLLVYGMLLYGAINLMDYIPAMGRFRNLVHMVIIAASVLFLSKLDIARPLDRQLFVFKALLLSINTALGIRFSAGFASVWLLAGNIFVAPFVTATVPLYDAVMSFLIGR